MPHLEVKANVSAGKIIHDAEAIKHILESQLASLSNGSAIDSVDFQKGIIRSLIEAFSMIHELAKITQGAVSRSMLAPGGIGTPF